MHPSSIMLVLAAGSPMALAAAPQGQISAPAGYFELCRIAYTSTSGSATVRFKTLEAQSHANWNPHFGVILTDRDDNVVYKVAVLARIDPLRLVEAQQLFAFSQGGKEVGNALQQIAEFEPPADLTVDFGLEWRESGFVQITLNGRPLGLMKSSRSHQQWNVFVSGMTLGLDLVDAEVSECKK